MFTLPALTAVLVLTPFVQDTDPRAGLETRLDRLERDLPGLLERASIPGISIAVVHGDGTIWTAASGRRGSDGDDPVDRETIFGAASLTKPVFAYMVMKMVEAGELDLDRPLAEYLPYEDIAHDDRSRVITARMVLSHTTGLPNWRPRNWSPDPGALTIEFEPGSRWQYSGEGIVYLQRVVEHLTGRPVEALVRTRVFEPLSMTRSSFVWEERFAANAARPHREDGSPRPERHPTEANAAGTMQTTASDYARFLAALINAEGFDDPQTFKTMLARQIDVSDGVGWGLGFGLQENALGTALWQWGHDPGHRAFMMAYPGSKTALVFLTNSDGGMLLLKTIVERVFDGHDHPALDHLDYVSYDDPRRLVAIDLERTIREHGAAALGDRYDALRRIHPEGAFEEAMLNALGYRLLGAGQVDEAIAVFELNVRVYPDAFNTHDSMGEAYMTRGDTERAIASYRRSLELNPENTNADQMIKRLAAQVETTGAGG